MAEASVVDISQARSKARALALVKAAGHRIRHFAGTTYFVPSQTLPRKRHLADWREEVCTCEDSETRGLPCVHVIALKIHLGKLDSPELEHAASVPLRSKDKRDWSKYNRAKAEEKKLVPILAYALCKTIVEPLREGPGRPPFSLQDVIFMAIMKMYLNFSARRVASDIEAYRDKHFIKEIFIYNTLLRFIASPALTPILERLVQVSFEPLLAIERHFAIDASGLATATYARWRDRTASDMKRHDWRKVHVLSGTATCGAAVVRVTESRVHDSKMFEPLFLTAIANGATIEYLSADKAYLVKRHYVLAEKHNCVLVIPFKKNSRDNGPPEWMRARERSKNVEWFLSKYHPRSKSETGFSAVKTVYGGALRSKTATAKVNEALLKFVCHNLSVLIRARRERSIQLRFGTVTVELPENVDDVARALDGAGPDEFVRVAGSTRGDERNDEDE